MTSSGHSVRIQLYQLYLGIEIYHTTIQNLQNAAKVVFRGKLIAIQAFLKKKKEDREKSQINNLTYEHKDSRRKKIIKIRKELKEFPSWRSG